MPIRRTSLVVSLLAIAALTGCAAPVASDPEPTRAVEVDSLVLTSTDIDADGYLPDSARGNVEQYCGDGENISPNFEWTGVPDGTESFVLLMTDPNYPSYVHWVVTGIPADSTSLAAAVDGAVEVGVVGENTRGEGDYVGPCQADNGYLYTLYALDFELVGEASTTLMDVVPQMSDHILARAEIEAKRH